MSAPVCARTAGREDVTDEVAEFLASLPIRLRIVHARRARTREGLPARAGCGDDPVLGELAQAVWDADADSARALAARYRALAALFDREDSADHGEDHVDDDIVTIRAAAALRVTHGAARWQLRHAHRAVEQLPRTLSLLEEGRLPSAWFQRMLRTSENLTDHSRRLLDITVATWSPDIPADRFITLLNALVDLLARREDDADEPAPPPPRAVTLARGRRAGTGTVDIDGPVPEILAYWRRLDESARAVQAAQRKALREGTAIPHDLDGLVTATGRPVPLDRLRYELQLHAAFDTDGVRVPQQRFRINVTVPVMTLLGASDAPGTLEGTTPIPPELARALAGGEITWYRVLVDDCSGAFLPLPADRYTPSAAMLEHLRLRNGTCAVPGCTRPTSWASEADHIEEFDHDRPEGGGRTALENLHLLCWQHHQDKTAGLLDPTRLPTPVSEPGRTRWRIGADGDHVTAVDDTDSATQLTIRQLEKSWERHRRGRRMAAPPPEPPTPPEAPPPEAPPPAPGSGSWEPGDPPPF